MFPTQHVGEWSCRSFELVVVLNLSENSQMQDGPHWYMPIMCVLLVYWKSICIQSTLHVYYKL